MQLVLVCCLYFEKPYTLTEYEEARGTFQAIHQGDQQEDGRHSTMTFSLADRRGVSSTGLEVEKESDSMRAVPWTASRNPEAAAGLLSRLTFSWMSPLFSFAHKHELEQDDIFDIRAMFQASVNSEEFERVWEAEKSLRGAAGEGPSLVRALSKGFLWALLPSAPLLMIQNVAQLTLPFLLGPLIEFMVRWPCGHFLQPHSILYVVCTDLKYIFCRI